MRLIKRFLIVDSNNNAQKPSAHGFSAPSLTCKTGSSFTDRQAALDFGSFLAKRNPGQEYTLFESAMTAVSYTKVKPEDQADWQATAAAPEAPKAG